MNILDLIIIIIFIIGSITLIYFMLYIAKKIVINYDKMK